ncbi:hypothetical protein SDC9_46784 [bioreactor metagenome]|uniref:DUF1385 domain-containing protein n=1 Tax=bioreactor metagenome TaxID=1076179 RepID=A0A644WAL8_9ZZZZ
MPEQKQNSKSFKTMIGGQAIIEGIMMIGPKKKAIVVRKPDGELEVKEEERTLIKDRYPILGYPILRGIVGFGSSMTTGVKALMWSTEFFPEEEEEPSKFERWLEGRLGSEKMTKLVVSTAVFMGIAFSVGLFILLPTLISGGLAGLIPGFPLWGRSVLEGILRVAIFLGYLIMCSRLQDIKRVFSYHGAEHKTVFCYEAGLPLTVENVRPQPCHHPRCGTSFLFVVIIVSILVSMAVFTPLHIENTFVRMGLHLLILPLIVGVTYEFNRYIGGHDNGLCRFMRAPGLWLQNFTTNEPDDTMIEVGIRALTLVLPEEKGKDEW